MTEALSTAEQAALARVERVSGFLDDAVRIPVVGVRVGADPVLGLIPGVGDALAALLSLYVVAEAWRLGAGRWTLLRMLLNVAVDAVVGTVPVVGDLFDVGWRANRRNAALLERSLRD